MGHFLGQVIPACPGDQHLRRRAAFPVTSTVRRGHGAAEAVILMKSPPCHGALP